MSVERFMIKRADILSVLPMVAAPALGAFGGKALGTKYPAIGADIGALVGGITGGVTGGLLKERAEKAEETRTAVPPGAPFALDATSADIPPWALQGAQLLQPAMKQAAERDPVSDVVLSEIPGYSVVEKGISHGPGAAARTFGGMALGGVGGGLLGAGLGYGAEKLLGHQVNVPGVGMSLPDLLASLGGTIGATKGLRYMKG